MKHALKAMCVRFHNDRVYPWAHVVTATLVTGLGGPWTIVQSGKPHVACRTWLQP